MSILLSPGTKGSTRPVCDCQRLAGAQSQQLPDNLIPTTFHSQEAFYETTVATHCPKPWYLPQVTCAALIQDCAPRGRHDVSQGAQDAWTAKAAQVMWWLKQFHVQPAARQMPAVHCNPRQNSIRHIPGVPESCS